MEVFLLMHLFMRKMYVFGEEKDFLCVGLFFWFFDDFFILKG